MCDNHQHSSCEISFYQSELSTLRKAELSKEIELVHYCKTAQTVTFERNDVHTLSFYIKGGYQTYQEGEQLNKGAPNTICLMPQASNSIWHVGATQELCHLYFSDKYLKRLALQTFDIETRFIELPFLSFEKNPKIKTIFRQLIIDARWQIIREQMALEQSINTLLIQLISEYYSQITQPRKIKGGLSPATKKQVISYINEHLYRSVSLKELADVAKLSEYHFCRAFKDTLNETPHQYIIRQRLEKVKQHLTSETKKTEEPMTLAELAQTYGFSHQSHMGRLFKKHFNLTPKQYLTLTNK